MKIKWKNMAQLSCDELLKCAHSPAHYAVARRDHAALQRIISKLPKLANAGEIRTEAESILEEQRADAISAVIDRRDVPNRETPLHLAVRLGDSDSAQMLMGAGANWSLQNEQGWSSLQEAICNRQDEIAMIIMRHYQPMAWAKWCRRLPRLIACMRQMHEFHMQINFQFDSSIIPFLGRIAPSDTYRIWKRDSNLRADMTLAGFDGLKIQRSDQSFLFLGEGSDDGRISLGSPFMLNHKYKEIMNTFEDVRNRPSKAEVAQEDATMSETNVYRPGIDVTRAELVNQLNWRRQEKSEMVGSWKAKVYEMHNVMLSFKSRRVPGAKGSEKEEYEQDRDYLELLTEEERHQMENVLKMGDLELEDDVEDGFLVAERPADLGHRHSSYERGDFYLEKKEKFTFSSTSSGVKKNGNFELRFSSKEVKEEKGWVGWGRRGLKDDAGKNIVPPRGSLSLDEKVSDLLGPRISRKTEQGRRSLDVKRSDYMGEDFRKKDGRKWVNREPVGRRRGALGNDSSSNHESVYKKGLRPVLWLTPQFPVSRHSSLLA